MVIQLENVKYVSWKKDYGDWTSSLLIYFKSEIMLRMAIHADAMLGVSMIHGTKANMYHDPLAFYTHWLTLILNQKNLT
jgi:hypothetical protein